MDSRLAVTCLVMAVSGFTSSCGAQRSGAAAPPISPSAVASCAECRVVSFKRDVLTALQNSCLACHYSKDQSPGLDLSTADAYSELVNRKSRLNPQMMLVKPSSVQESFLMDKLATRPRIGEPMPPYGRPLTPEEKGRLAEWIRQGARNN